MEKFLSKEAFEKLQTFTGKNNILNWKELEEDVIFMVISIEPVLKAKYESYFLNIIDGKENQLKVYAPSHMIEAIRLHRAPNFRPYFTSLGLSDNEQKKCAKFCLKFSSTQKDFNIFTQNDPMELPSKSH